MTPFGVLTRRLGKGGWGSRGTKVLDGVKTKIIKFIIIFGNAC